MRPVGDVRQAILKACRDLATDDRGATLAELTVRAQVGRDAARRTIDNLRRSGELEIARTRRVTYRARPVAEYAPRRPAPAAIVDLAAVFALWPR